METHRAVRSCPCGQEERKGRGERRQKKSEPTLPHTHTHTSFLKIQTRLRASCGFNLGTPTKAAAVHGEVCLVLPSAVDGKMVAWLVGYLPQRPAAAQHTAEFSGGLANCL